MTAATEGGTLPRGARCDMFGVGQREGLDRTDARTVSRWRRNALLAAFLGGAIAAVGIVGLQQSWGFLTFLLGAWLALIGLVRAGYLSWHLARRRPGEPNAPAADHRGL
jgi:hypothetical protein